MINNLEIMSNRAMSSYPISIGTSLALESIIIGPNKVYDESRVIPNKVNLNKYDYFYVNVMTLYRNIYGSINKQDEAKLLPSDYSQVLEQECTTIKEIIKNISNDKVKLVFYCSKYKNLDKEFPNVILRTDNTDKQMYYSNMLQSALNDFFKSDVGRECIIYDNKIINSKRVKALILTHYAYDLLMYNHFELLDLLESHTGVLKNKTMFYSKLNNGKDLIRIPFNRVTFQIFGDKEFISPMPIKIRKLVIDLSNKYNWTQVTTLDRLHYCFDQLEDHQVSSLLKSLK